MNLSLIHICHHRELNIYNAFDEHLQIIDLILEEKYEQASQVIKNHVIHNRDAMIAHLLRYQQG